MINSLTRSHEKAAWHHKLQVRDSGGNHSTVLKFTTHFSSEFQAQLIDNSVGVYLCHIVTRSASNIIKCSRVTTARGVVCTDYCEPCVLVANHCQSFNPVLPANVACMHERQIVHKQTVKSMTCNNLQCRHSMNTSDTGCLTSQTASGFMTVTSLVITLIASHCDYLAGYQPW